MYIDIALGILFLLATIKGYRKGFIQSVFSILGYLAGMFLAVKCSAWLAVKMQEQSGHAEKWYPFFAFILILAITVVTVNMIGRVFKKVSEEVMMGWLDKSGGVLLHLIIYGLVASMVLYFFSRMGWLSEDMRKASLLYGFVEPMAPTLMDYSGKIIPAFRGLMQELDQYFQ